MSSSDNVTLHETLEQLHQELENMGVFRRGTLNVLFRKCGKSRCRCAQEGHPGHGPQTTLTYQQDGKTRTINLANPAEVDLVRQQIGQHRQFQQWCRKWLALNEQICERQLQECRSQQDPKRARKKKPLSSSSTEL